MTESGLQTDRKTGHQETRDTRILKNRQQKEMGTSRHRKTVTRPVMQSIFLEIKLILTVQSMCFSHH